MLAFAAMRGTSRSLMAASVAVLVLAAPAAPAQAHHLEGPCDVHRREGESVRSHSTRLIRCVVGEWEVPGGAEKAVCIADAESHLNPKAVSESGDSVGLFQHSADAWPDRFEAWTEDEWELDERALSGRSNAIVTIRMVNANGWGAWGDVGDC